MKKTFISIFGTMLFAASLAAQCLDNNFVEFPGKSNTSGHVKLDNLVTTVCRQAATHFGLKPDLWFFEDRDSPNAYAQKGCQSQGCDGSIWLGKSLLKYELDSLGKDAVAGIVAHEMAHLLQHKYKSSLTGKNRELQADFLAGYLLGEKAYFPDLKIQDFALSLMGKGDFDYHSSDHHGTPSQRFEAMMTGYLESESPLSVAYQVSERVAPSINPNLLDQQTLGAPPVETWSPETTSCDYCNGAGKRFKNCGSCQGTGRKEGIECGLCSGLGKQSTTCTHCQGTGRL